MDFPSFFQRPSRFQSITTRWFRGLACLTTDPTRRDGESIQPVTGEMFSDNDNPIHFIQKPLKVRAGAVTSGGETQLAAKPGVRYFIHSVSGYVRLVAADTTTFITMFTTINGILGASFYMPTVPTVAQAISFSQIMDVLTDENTAVTTISGVASPTVGGVNITYSEVGAAQ